MANNIKGITIQIDGEATGLERAIADVDKQSQALSSELKQINSQLKFNPDSTVLLKQKFDVLTGQVEKTREKLKTLEDAQEKVEEQFQNGEIDDGQYRAFQRELEKTQNYLEYLEEEQGKAEEAFTRADLSDKYEDLQGKIDDAQTHLEELQSIQEQFSDEDIDSSEYQALAEDIESATAELESLQAEADAVKDNLDSLNITAGGTADDLGRVSDSASNSRTEMGDASDMASAMSSALSQASQMAGTLGGAIGGLLSGGLDGLVEVLGQVVEAVIEFAMSFDEANSILVEKTGASGEALDEFNEIAKQTSMIVDNTDVTGMASVVGELSTRLDLTGDSLRESTYLIGQFADATGSDAEGAVVNLSKVMKNWDVDAGEMEGLLDKLTVAGQKTGISVDKLSSDLVTHKAQLKEMGFSLDESIAMLSTFEKEGINSSRVMTGFNTAVGKWAKEGKNAKKGFEELSSSIQNASSDTEAIALATDYFGRRSAQELVYAIRSGRFEFDELSTAIENSNGAMLDTEARADTFGEKAETFGRAIGTVAMGGESLTDIWTNLSTTADEMNISVGDAISQYLGLTDAEQQVIDKSPEMEEYYKQEQERLQKQAEFEQLATKGYEGMSDNMDSIGAKIEDLNKQYNDNYDTAYKNISGSIGLFEDMTIKSGKSVTSMIDSLKSQVKYMDNYSSNMKRAVELGVDQGLINKLSDGSKESAEILQSIVDDGGEHIGELNEEFSKVEEGKKTFSDTYASMVTDFDTKMGQIETRLGLAVDSMDQYKEAYDNGSDTVKGFIKGSQSHYREIYDAYKKVAEQANRAVKTTLQIKSPSRVMMQLGEYTAEGFADGVLKEMDVVENAFSRMAKVPEMTLDDMGTLTTNRTMKSVTVNAPVQVLQRLDDAELNRVGGRITDIVGRQFAHRIGGSM